jgi:hypothetical protein
MSVGHGLQPIHTGVIPAHPGWTVVSLIDDQSLYRVPVIAWQIDVYERQIGGTFSAVTAITAHGSVDDVTHALQSGDGPFSTVFGDYDDEAGVLLFVREEEKKRRGRAGRK